jgi:hypothetical protein
VAALTQVVFRRAAVSIWDKAAEMHGKCLKSGSAERKAGGVSVPGLGNGDVDCGQSPSSNLIHPTRFRLLFLGMSLSRNCRTLPDDMH